MNTEFVQSMSKELEPKGKGTIRPKVATRGKSEQRGMGAEEVSIQEERIKRSMPIGRAELSPPVTESMPLDEEEMMSPEENKMIMGWDISTPEELARKMRKWREKRAQGDEKATEKLRVYGKWVRKQEREEKKKKKSEAGAELQTLGHRVEPFNIPSPAQVDLVPKRSMSEETTLSEQGTNWESVQSQSEQLRGVRLPDESVNLRAASIRDSDLRRGWMKPDASKAEPSKFTTSLLRGSMEARKNEGQRVPLSLQPRSTDLDQVIAGELQSAQNPIQSSLSL